MKSLFIGGPKDGLRMDTEGRPSFTFAVMKTGEMPSSVLDNQPMVQVYYRRHRVCGIEFYVYSQMSPDQAVEELFRRYPKPSKEWSL